MSAEPIPNGSNGNPQRDERGRFILGWRGGPGNPHAKQAAALRAALLSAVNPDDIEKIIGTLIAAAKGGDIQAAREVLDRSIGKAVASDILQRIEALEAAINEP